ncbi:MAG: phosphatase PAP2 family protein [Halochromatium sp.]
MRASPLLAVSILFFALADLWLAFPQIDLAIASLFWTPEVGFAARGTFWEQVMYGSIDALLVIVGLGLIGAWARGRWRASSGARASRVTGRRLACLLLLLALVPGLIVNALLKEHWGRARPAQLEQFGGHHDFSPAFIVSDQGGGAFPSGHVAAAAWLVAVPVVLFGLGSVWTGLALLYLLAMVLARMAAGAHFLSDTLTSILLVWLGFLILQRRCPPAWRSRSSRHAPRRGLLRTLFVVAFLALAVGCETQSIVGTGPELDLEQLQERVAASDWEAIVAATIDCDEPSDTCAEVHAIQADACLRLAIQLPAEASATGGRTRRLLDAAEAGYREALRLQRSREAPAMASYHGGLLLTLSERRNRLDASVREQKLARENQKLLEAANQARAQVPDSALGFIYSASALLYHALLMESGSDRCHGLGQAEAMLKQTPVPPAELVNDHQRLQTLIDQELGKSNCARAPRPS